MRFLIKVVTILCLSLSYIFLFDFPIEARNIDDTAHLSQGTPTVNINGKKTAVSNQSAYDIAYTNILNALKNYQDTTTFPSKNISYKEVGPILTKVLADHPEIFYFQYKGTLFYSSGKIELKYKYSKATIKKMVQQLNMQVESIIDSTINDRASDFEKVKAIHDYVVLNSAYDYANFVNNTIPDASYNAYGLLINKIAVCDGYAKAMKLLLERVGIKTYYVTGTVNTGLHAWNLVNIDGEYYYIDTTWDDPVPNRKGRISYKYFLVPTSYLKKDHAWKSNEFPNANVDKYAYLREMSSFQETENYYYYSNSNDSEKLYRINKDGSGKVKILNARAPYFVIKDKTIYFSNYSQGGYLYKATIQGTGLTKMNKVHSIDLYIQESYLYYTNKDKGRLEKIRI
ncbi:DUF5050 domain-containing protein [Bacillus massiliigorillae]|uniref:DUF5050 domain-containing protein n=1 Tax=Bacillus massiliigorillae TaxID=1243664 RepID=UPI0006946911|nr:DUF5050 domain-containing protein [Bacillus massiliigorillae]